MLILEKMVKKVINCECLYRGSREQITYGLSYTRSGIKLWSWGINLLILKESETNKEIKDIKYLIIRKKR